MRYITSSLFVATMAVSSCARSVQVGTVPRESVATVTIRSASGDSLGTLGFVTGANGAARLIGALSGIPAGRHGIHVHQTGRCDAPAFTSAGGHFNPAGKQHGLENPMGSHAGDAPNIEADASMKANVDITFAGATLGSASNSLLDADGSAVVIHAAADDQRTDPSGNSGARIACGVVVRTAR